MTGHRITFTTRDGSRPEDEAQTLANVYVFLINRSRKAAGTSGGLNDATKGSTHDRAERSIPERT